MALWDGDFSSLTSRTQRAYALNLNGNTLSADNASVTISSDYGVLLDSVSDLNLGASTVIIRCSDLNLSSEACQILFTSRNSGDSIDSWKNLTGVYLKPSNASTHGIWGAESWEPATATATETALPSGVTSLAYQSGPSGAALYAIAKGDDGAATCTNVYTGANLKTDRGTFAGCAIGGPRDVAITGMSAATGLKITGVAVFDSRLSADDIASYAFPSDAATRIAGTKVTATQINEKFGSNTSVSVLLDAGATLVLDTALTATSVTIYSPGSITIKSSGDGSTQADATELAKLNFDNVRGGVLRSWFDTTKAFGFSFNSSQGSDTTGALYEGTWKSDASSADGTADDFFGDSLSTLSWHSANLYKQGTSSSSFLNGYLDDGSSGNKTTISVSNVPFETYDVVIYCATDTGSAKFAFKTVNGTSYCFGQTSTETGTSSWGATSTSRYVPVEGVNTLIVRGLSGNLSISSYKVSNTVRGCIAAIQIKPHGKGTLTLGGESADEVKWSDATKWSDETVLTFGSAVLQMEGDATLVFDKSIDMDSVAAENAAGKTLTLTNSSETTVNVRAFDAGGAEKVVVKSADIAIDAMYHGLFEYDYDVASLASSGESSVTNVYVRGAGSEESPLTLAHNGGSVTLSGETPFYLADNLWSSTQTAVTFDGAKVNYLSDDGRFSIGKAAYVLTNATVTAKKFILSQGAAGLPASLTLAGSSVLTVTGNVNADQNTSSVMFGHWNGSSTFTIKDDAQFLASSAQVLVGKTGNNHTININGGLFSANGIKLSGNATGTNKLNLNGGTLALGSTGITTYNASRTMAVTVGGDATMMAKEATFPVSQVVTVAEGATLTLDKTNTLDSATFTFSSTVSGSGTLAVKAGVTASFGTVRPTCKISVAAEDTSAKISFTQAYAGEQITISATLADGVTVSNFILYDPSGTQITARITKGDDGSVTLEKAIPVLTVSSASVDFSNATLWSNTDSSGVPTSGEVLVKNTTGADATVNVNAAYGFSQVNVQSEGASVTFAFGDSGDLFSNVSDGVVTVNPATATLVVTNGGTYAQSIQGLGKVKTVGDVTFTKDSSFTGGLTVASGTASTWTSTDANQVESKGFGGASDDATAGAITVEDGGCVDIAHTLNRCYTYTIAGKGVAITDADGTVTYSGAMKNSGGDMGEGSRQTRSITLAGDALITAEKNWGIVNSGHGATTLNLAGYTLTKQGAGEFFLINTTGTAGTIVVKEGTFSTRKKASTLTGSTVKVVGTSTMSLNFALNGLSALVLSPAAGGVTLTSLGNLAASTPVKLNGAYLDGNDIDSTAGTVTLVKGSSNTITNGFATLALGGRFSGTTYSDDGAILTATLQTPTKFFHYDFNNATVSAADAKASDSVYQLSDLSASSTSVSKGRTGSSARFYSGYTPYCSGSTYPTSTGPLDVCGAITVTTVARLSFGGAAPIWCIGAGSNGGANSSSIILRAVDSETVAAVAFDGTSSTIKSETGRELVRVTGIENLSTQFHFFALVVTGEGSRLYVDRMDPVSTTQGAPTKTMAAPLQFGAIYGNHNINDYKSDGLGSTGFYLDDFQVYDAALSDAEVKELRRTYCPDPFFILVK